MSLRVQSLQGDAVAGRGLHLLQSLMLAPRTVVSNRPSSSTRSCIIFSDQFYRNFRISRRLSKGSDPRRDRGRAAATAVEFLEPRTLLSESATGQVDLVSTSGSGANAVYHYNITIQNTGATHIGTFWFAWLPGVDFLPTPPTSESSPGGWGAVLTGNHDNSDGTAIEWTTTSAPLLPGQSLDGFGFVTSDNPAALAAKSPTHPSNDTTLSEIYAGAPFSDAGFTFTLTPPAVATPTTTSVTGSPANTNHGDSATFTATVTSSSGNGAPPTGSVTFLTDGNPIGTSPLDGNGTATLAISTLASGPHAVTAQYSGDTTYSASTSTAFTQIVNAGNTPSTTALSTSDDSIQVGENLTITAVVAAVSPGGPTPTGNVIFSDNDDVLSTTAVQSDGSAVFSTSALPVGSDTLTATYDGDATYASSSSQAIGEIVTTPQSLSPAIVKSTLPGAIVAGVAGHGAVTLAITNATGSAEKGKLAIEIFAAADGSIDSSAIQLAHVSRSLNIKTTGPAATSIPVRISVGELPAGTYSLIARVVDPAGNNNDSASGATVVVAAPFISLAAAVTKNTVPTSLVAETKAHALVALRITNSGNITTPGATSAKLCLSASGVVDVSAMQLAAVTKPLRIHPGKSAALSIPVKQVPAIAAGSYTLIAQIIDANGGASEVTLGVIAVTAV